MEEAEQLCDRIVIMDRGRIVAEGTPQTLIKENASQEVVELWLSDDPSDDLAALRGISEHCDVLSDRILLYVENGEAAVNEVHRRGLSPSRLLIRRSTLEDVFLRLTGRTLVE
jgi:lipooligosaccharide transport system ATP-binding protein